MMSQVNESDCSQKMKVFAISNDEETYENIDKLHHNHENPYLTMVSAEVVYYNASNHVKGLTGELQWKNLCSGKILTRKHKIILCGVITLISTILCLVCGFSFMKRTLEEVKTTLTGKIGIHWIKAIYIGLKTN